MRLFSLWTGSSRLAARHPRFCGARICVGIAHLLIALSLAACAGGGDGGSSGLNPGPNPQATTYQLSGQISAAPNTLIDSDVNDTNASYVSNDSIAGAQVVPTLVNLAGYVNVAGAGNSGRSKSSGDVDDYFRVDAVQGQVATLILGDTSNSDIDLYLYDEAGDEVAYSIGTGKYEFVEFPASGRYYVDVNAYDGAGNYVLNIGVSSSSDDTAGVLQGSAEFVRGELIVRWRPSSDQSSSLSRADKSPAEKAMSSLALSKIAGAQDGDWLVKLDSPMHVLGSSAKYSSRLGLSTDQSLTAQQVKHATLEAVKRLRANPQVQYAEPNYIRRATAIPNDEFYRFQWHYPLINLPAAWDITTGANSVIVAVVDTGVLLNHPDLQGQLVAGYDFISDAARARDGDGRDGNPDDAGDTGGGGQGSSFHGTHVAGTIAAASNNSKGLAGVAWAARVMPVRVLGVGGGTSFDISQGVLFAAGLANASGTLPAKRADIINLSLGGGSFSQTEQNTYTQARNAGVIVVAAAGNEATTVPSYPAAYNGVISVSAVDINRNLASYSNSGSTIDVAAPGGDSGDLNGDGYQDFVASTDGDDTSGTLKFTYGLKAGTSMASPHVAGVVALMKSVNAALTPADIDSLLSSGRMTVDIGTPGRDNSFGYGLIDAVRAVQAAQNGTGALPPVLIAAPAVLNFAPGVTTQSVSLSNGGGQTLQVTDVQVSPAGTWLSVTPPAGSTNGLGTYTVDVDRGSLAAGAYSGSITFVSAANTVTVAVVMQVGSGTVTASMGSQYVLLVDADSGETLYEVAVNPINSFYDFQFTGIAAGRYKLYAGGDSDNDSFICGVGEACGAYASLDQPVTINVTGNRTGLNFSSSYVTDIESASQPEAARQKGKQVQRMTPTSKAD